MGLKLISRNERYPIETEYITGYDIKIETPRTSLAKMPETKNEIIVTLEVPKSEYKNDINVQTIMKWAEMSVNDQDYFRDIAVHFTTDEGINERSIVFTHAKITLEEFGNVKSDFVEITITINQRRDKFTGVMFGINLDDTYERAWYRANNPPTVNIVVPPDVKDNTIEYTDNNISKNQYLKNHNIILPPRANGEMDDLSAFDEVFGKIINYTDKVIYKSNKRYFFYSDGPETIQNKTPQALLVYSENKTNNVFNTEKYFPLNQQVDFEFYHKNYTNSKLIIGIMVYNENTEGTAIIREVANIMKDRFIENEGLERADEKIKEDMCADVELEFLETVNSTEKGIARPITSVKPGKAQFISYHELENNHRMYGRTRIMISCDNPKIKVRAVSVDINFDINTVNLKDEIDKSIKAGFSEAAEILSYDSIQSKIPVLAKPSNSTYNFKDNIWDKCINEFCGTGQFTGVLKYTQIDLTITNMEIGEYIMFGSYKRENTGEYPAPEYFKYNGKDYNFGNFGIIYNVMLVNPKGENMEIYPFGHSAAFHFRGLISHEGPMKSWEKIDYVSRTISQAEDDIYRELQKYDKEAKENGEKDITTAARYFNSLKGRENKSQSFSVKNKLFSFLLPGGNCGGIKFKLIK